MPKNRPRRRVRIRSAETKQPKAEAVKEEHPSAAYWLELGREEASDRRAEQRDSKVVKLLVMVLLFPFRALHWIVKNSWYLLGATVWLFITQMLAIIFYVWWQT